ncbi:MAG: flagellar basal body rod protein FlgC [Defluviitaleaceae bacterium]|nr:flagellar basal body rod protein FlgC [Defluviitaleaceae bacterium]
MSFFASMNVNASGLTAQRLRMDVISQNIANATTTRTAEGGPYRRKSVVLQSVPDSQNFGNFLDNALEINRLTQGTNGSDRIPSHVTRNNEVINSHENTGGVRVAQIREDETPGPLVYDPSHPHANEEGYVEMPNVNIVYEMVNMMSASRSYEANMTALSTTRAMISRTLEIGQSL